MRLLFLLLPAILLAAEPPQTYICLRTESPIVVDGNLNDAAWAAAAWSDDFVDIEGNLMPLPRYRTRVKMLWDEQYLYIGAELEEPHVWATISKRDDVIFHDNDFEVFLDPDGDNHQYGELEINALNTQWDLFLPKPYKDNGHALNEWNIEGLRSAVQINGTLNDPSDIDSGWTVEIAMPWRGLEMCRSSTESGFAETWYINFSRVEWDTQVIAGKYVKVTDKPEHNWVWSPQGVIDMHRPEMWATVKFEKDTSHYANFTNQMKDRRKRFDTEYRKLRETAYQVYYAEHLFYKKHGRWARNTNDLGFQLPIDLNTTIDFNAAGWTVNVMSGNDNLGHLRSWRASVRDDAKFQWHEPIHIR